MVTHDEIVTSFSRLINGIIDVRLSYYNTVVDKRITYYIDNDGNGNPDWDDSLKNTWAEYQGND